MKKQINFIYAALIIALVCLAASKFLLQKIEDNENEVDNITSGHLYENYSCHSLDTKDPEKILYFPALQKSVVFSDPFIDFDYDGKTKVTYYATVSIMQGRNGTRKILESYKKPGSKYNDADGFPEENTTAEQCDGSTIRLDYDWDFGGGVVTDEDDGSTTHFDQRESEEIFNLKTEQFMHDE